MTAISRFSAAANWNLEQSYENQPRRPAKKSKKDSESTRLPIKTAHGIVRPVRVPDAEPGSSSSSSGGEEAEDEEWEGIATAEPTTIADTPSSNVPERQRVLEAKEELARIAALVNEDPEENLGLLRRLQEIAQDRSGRIQKLALATQVAVYVDVIPGYRIRPLSEEEQAAKVSKEVKKLRTFEQGLVANYKNYVQNLVRLARSLKTDPSSPAASVGKTAVTCACRLLLQVPHFNFRIDLLQILVDQVGAKSPGENEGYAQSIATLEELFRNDEDGHASLEAVQLLTRMLKGRRYYVNEAVLNTFLSLRLLSELDVKASQDRVDNPRKRKRKEREFRTKKMRKDVRDLRKVEEEMKEADATVSHEQRERMQSDTLKLVFATYFRILKERVPGLMAATLEGLAKYAHLINLDFFGDLLVALKEMITAASEEGNPTTTRESLLCVTTAFALLSGQGDSSIAVDLEFFSTHLYTLLLPLSLNADLEYSPHKSLRLVDPGTHSPARPKVNVPTEVTMLLRAVDALLFKHVAGATPTRTTAFAKRLLLSSLNMPEKSALASLGAVTKLRHKRGVAALFSTEEAVGDGVYALDADVPEMSNPHAATAWETVLLEKHYSPEVAGAAVRLRNGGRR